MKWDGSEIEISGTSLYSIITIIYLFNLNALNQELRGLTNPVEIMAYDSGKPFLFLAGAIILVSVGLGLIYYLIRVSDKANLVTNISCGIIVVVLIVIIAIFIDNPIFRSAIVVGLGLCGIYAKQKS